VSKKVVRWNIPVTKEMDERVEKAVLEDSHVSKSELIRDAVRRLLATEVRGPHNEEK
jgi:Arc/MetJ-type ribon-helix-helix transcriptional regulator